MKTSAMKHQTQALVASEGKRNFAFLMEQGTGKTWTTLADAERCFVAGKIDALLIIAPKGVHTNWVLREIPKHMSIDAITVAWRGRPTSAKAKAEIERLYATHHATPKLRVFAINIDAVNTPHGYEAIERFLETFNAMAVVDESTKIKNPKSKRTVKCVKLGRLATARRILSGTPLTKAPTDLFSQFDYLKPGLLGTTSYRAFVAEYAVLVPAHSPKMQAILRKTGGRGGVPQVIETDDKGRPLFKNLDKLRSMIVPHSFRVRKDECLDLPPKVYKTVMFELEPKQRAVYDRLKEDYAYLTSDYEDKAFQAIAARTKMKQVTSGFIFIDGVPTLVEENQASSPRMEVFKDIIDTIEDQFIVWAMFEEEINQVMRALDEAGISAVSYYGATKAAAREAAIDDFQEGKVRAFVGHAAAAGIGLTLTAAETAIYYSCSYDNELRMQSEDRCHRIGTKKTVLYIDLIAENTIDEDIARSLQMKTELADQVIDGR